MQATRRKIPVRKLTVLLLLAAPGKDVNDRAPIAGTTRMQKLVFLAQAAVGEEVRRDETFDFDFTFDADRFGPADLELYQDLELLKATGLISINGGTGISQPVPQALVEEGPRQDNAPLLPEDREETEISFDYLMGEHTEEAELAEAEREFEKIYRITEAGLALLERIRRESAKADKFDLLKKACDSVKREYGPLPLSLLLRHVYTAFPETTARSEIRGRVLR